jgi:hypothetical protein
VNADTRRATSKNSPVPPCGTPPNSALITCGYSALRLTHSGHALTRFDTIKKTSHKNAAPKTVLGAFALKSMAPEPEKMSTLSEDQQLMPKNEPEKNLKIQLPFSPTPSASPSRSLRLNPPRFLGHFHISIENLWPFPQSQASRSKSPAISTVPLCSALFRQNFLPAIFASRFASLPPLHLCIQSRQATRNPALSFDLS